MIYSERIKQARELHSLTQTDLSRAIDVSQPAIAYIESGRNIPTREVLEAIARETGVLPSFFEQPPIVEFPVGSLIFRARASMTAKQRAQAYQFAKTIFEHVALMGTEIQLPECRLPKLTEQPIKAAQVTRTVLGLPPDKPVGRLINILEHQGVLVFVLPIPVQVIDAFSTWVYLETERPVIAVASGRPGDRLRFSVAHELAHLVIHQAPRGRLVEIEKAADQFAAEFLLPTTSMRQQIVPPVSLTNIAKLKLQWGVSMQAIIRRAYDLDIISERQYRYFFEQMGSRGWRTREPRNLDVPVERPQIARKMVELLYGNPPDVDRYASAMHLKPMTATTILREFAGPLQLSSIGGEHPVGEYYTKNLN